jgi:hypothetical protein
MPYIMTKKYSCKNKWLHDGTDIAVNVCGPARKRPSQSLRTAIVNEPSLTMEEQEMTDKMWTLQPGVKMDDATAAEVAKIACALKSLSAYTSMALEQENAPDDLQQIVDEGLEAMKKIFVW